MGLSEKFQAAVAPAVNMIETLIANLRGGIRRQSLRKIIKTISFKATNDR